jgi:phage-related protein
MSADGLEVHWASSTRDTLRGFPEEVRWAFGRALYRAQLGNRPHMASSMKGMLRGIVELATRHRGVAFRLYYTLECPGRIYVLYCHRKKSKRGSRIPRRERDLIKRRFDDSLEDCRDRPGAEG